MKAVLFFLALVPMVLCASLYSDDEIEKRLSIDDIITHLQKLDLSGGCVAACETYVGDFWTFLCSAACKIILEQTG
ncbi:Hypothetical predicted protein [Octopus vulgaris]|uniref:Uncharacterized protein n=1 Tax=Octopus vulgaris TaxID=6645 RepID=A0AA36BM67_OCTVU|nr:Hypothetical predicted protein [Octopus vulgaris]